MGPGPKVRVRVDFLPATQTTVAGFVAHAGAGVRRAFQAPTAGAQHSALLRSVRARPHTVAGSAPRLLAVSSHPAARDVVPAVPGSEGPRRALRPVLRRFRASRGGQCRRGRAPESPRPASPRTEYRRLRFQQYGVMRRRPAQPAQRRVPRPRPPRRARHPIVTLRRGRRRDERDRDRLDVPGAVALGRAPQPRDEAPDAHPRVPLRATRRLPRGPAQPPIAAGAREDRGVLRETGAGSAAW